MGATSRAKSMLAAGCAQSGSAKDTKSRIRFTQETLCRRPSHHGFHRSTSAHYNIYLPRRSRTMSSEPSTPLMRQYHAIKQQAPNALLMFRLGDFYELFMEDAITAARELEITLTSRNKEKGAAIPMCGVPYHAAEGYVARLINKGYRVAICDQMEIPGPGKKLVKREITRIVTPGTATDAHLLRSHENNYLAAVFTNGARNGSRAGFAYVDVSTGEF